MRRLRIVLVITACILAVPGVAGASWTGNGTGDALSKADTAPTGNRPTVSVSGRNVALSWAAASFTGGAQVAAYQITRYAAATGTPAAVNSGCAGDITTSCTNRAGT